MHVCIYIHLYTYAHTHKYIHTYIYMYIYTCVLINGSFLHTCTASATSAQPNALRESEQSCVLLEAGVVLVAIMLTIVGSLAAELAPEFGESLRAVGLKLGVASAPAGPGYFSLSLESLEVYFMPVHCIAGNVQSFARTTIPSPNIRNINALWTIFQEARCHYFTYRWGPGSGSPICEASMLPKVHCQGPRKALRPHHSNSASSYKAVPGRATKGPYL